MEKYQFIKEIGHGSYGEVWLVKCANTSKKYVLKRIDFHRASAREQRAAYQEAKLLSTIKHPNIVNYLDSFHNSEGSLFIVMGYCEYGDLYTFIRNRDGLYFQEEQIVDWFVQICMALKYLHDKNILHRDLKTQNIFLTKQKLIKVGDLGIARILKGKQDMATTLVGTPYYMSPEIFSGRPYNQKSDVWALGCCIYEVATLKHAFNARDLHSLMQKVLKGKVFVTSERYSSEFWSIISSMLDHEPNKRPSVTDILLNDYIRTHILLFLQYSSKRTQSAADVFSKDKIDVSKSENHLPPVSNNLIYRNTTESHDVKKYAKTVEKRIPDINGNGDGNDNSQEMHAKCNKSSEKQSSGKKKALIYNDKRCNTCENTKKKSQSVDMNNSFKENMNPTDSTKSNANNLPDSSKIQKVSNSPNFQNINKANGQKSFRFLNNLTYTLKNTRLGYRETFVETNVPRSSQGLVLYSKGMEKKLLDKRQSVSAGTDLACLKREYSRGGSFAGRNDGMKFSELDYINNLFSAQSIDGRLLEEILECNGSVTSNHSANSAARQRRREMKRLKAKNEHAKLVNNSSKSTKEEN